MDWSQLLVDLRARGWTQQLIAVHLGVFQSSISALATGKTKDPAFTLGNELKRLHESGDLPPAERFNTAPPVEQPVEVEPAKEGGLRC